MLELLEEGATQEEEEEEDEGGGDQVEDEDEGGGGLQVDVGEGSTQMEVEVGATHSEVEVDGGGVQVEVGAGGGGDGCAGSLSPNHQVMEITPALSSANCLNSWTLVLRFTGTGQGLHLGTNWIVSCIDRVRQRTYSRSP